MQHYRVLSLAWAALGLVLVAISIAVASPVQISATPSASETSPSEPAPGHFLVAKRSLKDLSFGQSVVYLLEHDETGTQGLIVNRSSDIKLSEALPDIADNQETEHVLHYGGPVGLSSIFMLIRSETVFDGLFHIANGVYVSTDRRVLDEILGAKTPENEVRFYLGYSGWAPGQLDYEFKRGSWHLMAADPDTIFTHDTQSLWGLLIKQLEPKLDPVAHGSLSNVSFR